MKKYISVLAIIAVLGFAGIAHANIDPSLTSPQTPSTYITFSEDTGAGQSLLVYDNTGTLLAQGPNPQTWSASGLGITSGTVTVVACSDLYPPTGDTLAEMRLESDYVSETSFTWGTPTVGGLVFFGGTSSGTGTGTMTNTAFLASVGSAFNATGVGFYPIVALIAGIIIALIVATKLIGLYKKTGKTTTKAKKSGLYSQKGKYLGSGKGTLKMVRTGVYVRD